MKERTRFQRVVQAALFLAVVLIGVTSLGLTVHSGLLFTAGTGASVAVTDNSDGTQTVQYSSTVTGGVSSVTGAGTVSCSPTTGAVVCTGSGSAVSSVTGSGGTFSCSPTTGSVACSLGTSGVTASTYGDSQHVAQIAVNAQGQVTAATQVAIFDNLIKTGFTNGSGVGTVGLTVGGGFSKVADTLTITGIPAGASADVWYSVEATGAVTGGTECTIDVRVDGSSVLTETVYWPASTHGATFPVGGRWTLPLRAASLSAGTHTFDIFAQILAGANGPINIQNAKILAHIVGA